MNTENNKLGHLGSLKAAEFLKNNPDAKLIDIRSSMEFQFIGHPVGSIHIPWMDDPDWDINPNFEEEIRKQQNNNCPIILICRSGQRSGQAGTQLIKADFSNIYHVQDGFEGDKDENEHRGTLNGWRYNGLPWEQC